MVSLKFCTPVRASLPSLESQMDQVSAPFWETRETWKFSPLALPPLPNCQAEVMMTIETKASIDQCTVSAWISTLEDRKPREEE